MRKITVLFLLIASASLLFSQDRALVMQEAAGPNAVVGKQWAVFIAIDRYREWPPLANPVRDASELRDILLGQYYIDDGKPTQTAQAVLSKHWIRALIKKTALMLLR